MAEKARVVSIQPEARQALPECSWEELNEPGAYVERGSGDLYRGWRYLRPVVFCLQTDSPSHLASGPPLRAPHPLQLD